MGKGLLRPSQGRGPGGLPNQAPFTNPRGPFTNPRGEKLKNWIFGHFRFFAPYGDSGRFDVTEWSGNTLRIEIDPVLPPFCLTE